MADYRVNLEIFAGPLDLLLYLVRKEEVDIYDIPIAKITEQYLRYLEMLKSLDMDLAGDFLVMAATLMQIKSAMLLPQTSEHGGELENITDPRVELIEKLLEYKRFKDAANILEACADEARSRFSRPSALIEGLGEDQGPSLDIEQVSIWDLLEAFDMIVAATGGSILDVSHITDDTPIDLYQIEVLHRLQNEGPMPFEKIFETANNRLARIGLFLAILELIREKLVWAEQSDSSNVIYLKAMTDEPAEQVVQKAVASLNSYQREQELPNEEQSKPEIPIKEIPVKETSGTVKENQEIKQQTER
jgi:segregation and condensation protein A